jgi:hypothetical protein
MSLTLHLNAVIIGGASSLALGIVLAGVALIALAANWGTSRGDWLVSLGLAAGVFLAAGGIVAALIGVGMAIR